LQAREATEALGLAVYDRPALANAANAMAILAQAQRHLQTLLGKESKSASHLLNNDGEAYGKKQDEAVLNEYRVLAPAAGQAASSGITQ
jgi:hypothetical protein